MVLYSTPFLPNCCGEGCAALCFGDGVLHISLTPNDGTHGKVARRTHYDDMVFDIIRTSSTSKNAIGFARSKLVRQLFHEPVAFGPYQTVTGFRTREVVLL